MSPVTQLIGFGLRQVIGDYADGAVQVVALIEQRFRDHSRTLPKALDHAHHRAWQALGVALAGDGLLDRVKVFFATGDDKGVRQLAHGLCYDCLRQLSTSQAQAFGEVSQSLALLGGQFDALLEQLGRIETAVEETHTVTVETHGAVLDIQTEL
jgi:hypothetical protein